MPFKTQYSNYKRFSQQEQKLDALLKKRDW